MDSVQVTERDLEVARQMQAPEQVIQSLEQGEWLYPSDREAVRFAELALDHMQDAYGQECRATWSTVPWVLDTNANVTLVVVGGEYDGAEVEVTISAAEPHTYTDTWGQLALQDGYHDLVADAEGRLHVWLPDGDYRFSIGGMEGTWRAGVSGADVVADFAVVPELEELHIDSMAVSGGAVAIVVSSVPSGWIGAGAASLRVRAAAVLPLPGGDAALLSRGDVGIAVNGDGTATLTIPRAADAPRMFYRVEAP